MTDSLEEKKTSCVLAELIISIDEMFKSLFNVLHPKRGEKKEWLSDLYT